MMTFLSSDDMTAHTIEPHDPRAPFGQRVPYHARDGKICGPLKTMWRTSQDGVRPLRPENAALRCCACGRAVEATQEQVDRCRVSEKYHEANQ